MVSEIVSLSRLCLAASYGNLNGECQLANLFKILVLTFAFTVFSSAVMAEQKLISVTAAYRERVALPPDAILEVELLDVSRADAPSTKLSYIRFRQDRVPFEVSLAYDEALIDERFTYVVAARMLSGGDVIFRTTSSHPVLTHGASNAVDLLLVAMPQKTPEQDKTGIAGIEWAAFEILGRMFIGKDAPSITFDNDGSFALFGGCNRFNGKAEVEDGKITFPDTFAGTRRACIPSIANLELGVLESLSASKRFERNGKNLVFLRDNGVVTMRFRERLN